MAYINKQRSSPAEALQSFLLAQENAVWSAVVPRRGGTARERCGYFGHYISSHQACGSRVLHLGTRGDKFVSTYPFLAGFIVERYVTCLCYRAAPSINNHRLIIAGGKVNLSNVWVCFGLVQSEQVSRKMFRSWQLFQAVRA